jgi:hypothetical protein
MRILSFSLLSAFGWLAACTPSSVRDQDTAISANASPRSNSVATSSSTGPRTGAGASHQNVGNTASALVPVHSNDSAEVSQGTPLSCDPKFVKRQDTVTIRMETPHGEYLAITQPGGTLFYLISPPPGNGRPDQSLISSEAFRNMPVVRFRADVRAKPSFYGRDTLETVFLNPGKYVLKIGSNLESESGSDIYKCTIQFAR